MTQPQRLRLFLYEMPVFVAHPLLFSRFLLYSIHILYWKNILNLQQKVRINNRITAPELRVIDDSEGNLGVMPREAALEKAREKGLDLIEISPNAAPPIAKIMDYGKYQYEQAKKQKKARGHITETKAIQVRVGTGEHDLELKAKKVSEFLREGHRVKIELFLAGRSKYMEKSFLEERLNRILHLIAENYKISENIRRGPKGLSLVIERERK